MKTTHLFLIVLFVITGAFFISCDKDKDGIIPPAEVKNTFDNMYPNAKAVEWEIENGHYVADFRENGSEKEAWFDMNGIWLMTKTEYKGKAPEIIGLTIAKTDYKDWRIDDVDYIESKDDAPYYIVELEKGQREVKLIISETGEILKEVPQA